MATIDRFTSRAEAELARGLLSAHGIEAHVRGDDAGGAYPPLPFGVGGMVVVVPDERLEEARELLDGSDQRVSAAAAATTISSTASSLSEPGRRPGWLRVLLVVTVALVVLVTFLEAVAQLTG